MINNFQPNNPNLKFQVCYFKFQKNVNYNKKINQRR